MRAQSRNIPSGSAALAFLAFLFWAPQNGTSAYAAQRPRGVTVLPPGEDMEIPSQLDVTSPGDTTPKDAAPQEAPKPRVQLGKVRVAVVGDDASGLAGLARHDAPIEIVKFAADPDVIWDPVSQEARSGSAVIAYGVDLSGLAAVIDRTAVLRELSRQATLRPQSIKLAGANGLHHKGESIEIVVDGLANRALLLVDIAGDGAAPLLYPLGADARLPQSSPYRRDLILREPFGTDVIVAITSAKPIDILEQRLKDSNPATNAVEFLALVNQNLPPDAHMGLLSLTTAP